MTNKTDFDRADFADVLSRYDLGNFVQASAFDHGAANSNWNLLTTKGHFAFRYYQYRSTEWALFEAELVTRLVDHGFPTPKIFADRQGQFIASHQGKPFAIFEFLEGEHGANPNTSDLGFRHREIAQCLARLHSLTADYWPQFHEHREGRDKESCLATAIKNAAKITYPERRAVRLGWLRDELKRLEIPNELPRGVCHGDINYTNFLFLDETLSGVLDFDMACCTYLVYDLANLIYWWTWPPGSDPDFSKIQALASAYQSQRKLSALEKAHLYDALKMATLMGIVWGFDDDPDFYASKSRIEFLNSMGREDFANRSFAG